jgi:divalent metal cation (Fe/Co/Zn/Cd) transporter
MITSSGVVLGIFLVWATGLTWLDPLVGILIGINVLVMAWSLMRRAYDGLMERADPQQTERIRDILRKAVKDNVLVDWHQLRHRIVDTDLWIEVHLLMASDQTLRAAHHAVTKLEDEIRVLFPGRTVRITTHLEPADHELDHPPGHPDHRQEDEIF